jgi:hypothetical protein
MDQKICGAKSSRRQRHTRGCSAKEEEEVKITHFLHFTIIEPSSTNAAPEVIWNITLRYKTGLRAKPNVNQTGKYCGTSTGEMCYT